MALYDGPVIDTHQHLWDLDQFRLPWLAGEPEVLRRSYLPADYLEAVRDLRISTSVYMEVNVAPEERTKEEAYVLDLCWDEKAPTAAAVIASGLDPSQVPADEPHVKGVRHVLHTDDTPPGFCLSERFVEGVRRLGDRGLMFDICIRPAELGDAATLARQCPETTFILDHCGNADPKAFMKDAPSQPWHDADGWKRDIDALADLSHVVCKVSGIVARAPEGWTAGHLAPIVNHCLDAFGPDRAIFGSDWPVCLVRAPLADWLGALKEIVKDRPAADQRRLFHDNASRLYDLE